MDENIYKVYVMTNSSSVITAINSRAFLADTSGWTDIDEGSGDKYHHAQNNYLDEPLLTETGAHNYKLVDGAVVHRTEAEITEEEEAIKHMSDIESFQVCEGSDGPEVYTLPDKKYYAVRSIGSSVGTVISELSGDAYSADDPHMSFSSSESDCSGYLGEIPASKKIAVTIGRATIYCSDSREALKEALLLHFGWQGNLYA